MKKVNELPIRPLYNFEIFEILTRVNFKENLGLDQLFPTWAARQMNQVKNL